MSKGFKICLTILGSIFAIIIILVIVVPKEEETIAGYDTSKFQLENSIIEILGQPKDVDSSGAISVTNQPEGIKVKYHFYPLGMFKYEDELGVELSSKIKEIFQKHSDINNLIISVDGLFVDDYGDKEWEEVVSFEFDQTTYNKVNWSNFSEQNLLNISKNVVWKRNINN